YAGVTVLADALADHVFGAEQVRLEHELVGHERGSAFTVAFEPAVLDGDRLLVVAGTAEGGVVEVVPLRAHRTQCEGDPRPVPRQQLVDVVREADGAADREIDILERPACLLGATSDVLEEYVRVLRHERCAEPAIRNLPRQLE